MMSHVEMSFREKNMAGLLFELDEELGNSMVRILVLGVGGAGGNAVQRMVRAGLQGVEFAVVNTDVQALANNAATTRIQIGKTLTRGLGTGAKPDLARDAVLEDEAELREVIAGADLVFVTAGMGGGTGTGAGPEIARIAREMGALTVGVVTRPFIFEMKHRMRRAEEGLAKMREQADTVIVVSNQRLMDIVDERLGLLDSFKVADDVLLNAVRGVSDMITIPGLINRDFADMREVMSVQGNALMGVGLSRLSDGGYGAQAAAEQAISSPLLEDVSIRGARKLLVNITGGHQLSLNDINMAMQAITDAVGQYTDVFLGTVCDERLDDSIQVTLVATGLKENAPTQEKRPTLLEEDGARQSMGIHRLGTDEARRETATPVQVTWNPSPVKPIRPSGPVTSNGGFSSGLRLVDTPELFDEPTIARQPVKDVPFGGGLQGNSAGEDLELPTFLRRTMD
jgi:cell division protein FtsZ